jgi:UDP-glucuronate 4-epimerase
MDVIEALEAALGRLAQKNLLPMQPGDMRATHADVTDLVREVGYRPTTDLRVGIQAFVDWFCTYYGFEQRGQRP